MEEEGFYEKLNKVNESSGLSLLFDFRDTSMDLHQFYKLVTGKGGYHKVTKDNKWEDVASSLNQEIQVPLTPSQLEKLYVTIIYQYEQMHHYRCPLKHNKTQKPDDILLDNFAAKWKQDDGFYQTEYHFKSKKIKHRQEIDQCGHDFYEMLSKLNESCGLSILFDFRDTNIDLYKFYKFVTQRGGYQQVTEDGKWENVAYDLNRENKVSSTPTQLQKLYATILYVFEQTYHYNVKHNKTPKKNDVPLESWDLNNLKGKRKHVDGIYTTEYHLKSKKIERHHVKQARKKPRVPLGSRNCFQMFLKMEGERLKAAHGDMVDTWKHLPSDNKRTYIEASKKDKERFIREMDAYEKHKKNQRYQHRTTPKEAIIFSIPKLNFMIPSQEAAVQPHLISCQDDTNHEVEDLGTTQLDGDYHVAVEPVDHNEIALSSNNSIVQMTFSLMTNAGPNDPIFDIDWDAYGELIGTSP